MLHVSWGGNGINWPHLFLYCSLLQDCLGLKSYVYIQPRHIASQLNWCLELCFASQDWLFLFLLELIVATWNMIHWQLKCQWGYSCCFLLQFLILVVAYKAQMTFSTYLLLISGLVDVEVVDLSFYDWLAKVQWTILYEQFYLSVWDFQSGLALSTTGNNLIIMMIYERIVFVVTSFLLKFYLQGKQQCKSLNPKMVWVG